MGTVLVLFFLLSVCGLIAYIGDLLGRRMGRKRLSAFGLRPKHTAILFTVVTGVLIAGVSLGAAFGVSPGVRLALTQGEALVMKNADLRRSVDSLNQDHQSVTAALDAKQREMQPLQERERVLRLRNEELASQSSALKARYRTLTQSVTRLESANTDLQRRSLALSGRNASLAARQKLLQGAVQQLQARNDGLVRDKGTLTAAAARLRQENAAQKRQMETAERLSRAKLDRLAQEERTLKRQVTTLKTGNTRLTQEKSRLAGENRQMATRSAELLQEQRTLTASLVQARGQVSEAQGQLKILSDTVDSLKRNARRLATEELIFAEREEVARRVVPANPPPEFVTTQLETLLYEVRHLALERRAKPNAEHREPAYLSPLEMLNPDGSRLLLRDEKDILAALTRQYTRSPDSIVLRAVSHENCLAGSPVPIALQVFRNVRVLREGEELASTRVHGGESEGAVLEELVRFLQSDVRLRALRLEMIPGPAGEVGEMRFEPLLEAMRKVRELGGWAKVGAVARQDTWSAGPLDLRFYVVRDGGPR